MKLLLLLPFLLFCGFNAVYSQNRTTGTIRGKLIDSASQQSLRDATVTILNSKDSVRVLQALSKVDGSFVIEAISAGNYILEISYQGYRKYYHSLFITTGNLTHDFGTIPLAAFPKDLGVVIVTSTPPIVVKVFCFEN